MNAVLDRGGRDRFDATEMDALNRDVFSIERELCLEGSDTKPDPEGNDPIDVLLLALQSRGMATSFVHPRYFSTDAMQRNPRPVSADVVGYLVGTGTHYLAVVRDRVRAPFSGIAGTWAVNQRTHGTPLTTIAREMPTIQPHAQPQVVWADFVGHHTPCSPGSVPDVAWRFGSAVLGDRGFQTKETKYVRWPRTFPSCAST